MAVAQDKYGLRAVFEKDNYNVGWNPESRAVTINGQQIDTSGLSLEGGRFMGSQAQMDAIRAQLTPALTQGAGNVTPRVAPQQGPAPARLNNLQDMASLYGINYDKDAIQKIFDDRTKSEFDVLRNQYQNTANQFADQTAIGGMTLADTIQRNQAASVANGASRGATYAQNQLAQTGFSQEAMKTATELAQERNLLNDKESAMMMENVAAAFEQAERAKQWAGNTAANIYSADVQGEVGQNDLFGRMYQADTENQMNQDRIVADTANTTAELENRLAVAGINYKATVEAAAKQAGVPPETFDAMIKRLAADPNNYANIMALRALFNEAKVDPKHQDQFINAILGIGQEKKPDVPPPTYTQDSLIKNDSVRDSVNDALDPLKYFGIPNIKIK